LGQEKSLSVGQECPSGIIKAMNFEKVNKKIFEIRSFLSKHPIIHKIKTTVCGVREQFEHQPNLLQSQSATDLFHFHHEQLAWHHFESNIRHKEPHSIVPHDAAAFVAVLLDSIKQKKKKSKTETETEARTKRLAQNLDQHETPTQAKFSQCHHFQLPPREFDLHLDCILLPRVHSLETIKKEEKKKKGKKGKKGKKKTKHPQYPNLAIPI
jgi:hypothetical protein